MAGSSSPARAWPGRAALTWPRTARRRPSTSSWPKASGPSGTTFGVDVLGLVITATDTPSLHRVLDAKGGSFGALADPDDVASTALDHLGDGPTWMCEAEDPLGPPPFGTLTRREAVLRVTRRASATEAQSATST
jgi:hypothetical protein